MLTLVTHVPTLPSSPTSPPYTLKKSIYDHFCEMYPNLPFRLDPNCISALVGPAKEPERIRVPLQLISFKSGQPERKLAPDLLADIIKQTSAKPQERFKQIANIVSDMRHNPAPEAWQIDMGAKLVSVPARVLRSCELEYGNGAKFTVDSNKGQWNLRGQGRSEVQFNVPASSPGFVVVWFDRVGQQQYGAFMDNLTRIAYGRGMILGDDLNGKREVNGIDDARRGKVAELLDSLNAKYGAKLGFILCVIPGAGNVGSQR